MENKKYLYLEFLRIIACFFVIFNHTGENGFFLFPTYSVDTWSFWSCMALSVFCKFAVPVFLAISGALLLGKSEKLSYIWKHRIVKFLVVLVVFSFLYYSLDAIKGYYPFDIVAFLKQLYSTQVIVPFWYLYVLIPFLMSLPFLRALVSKLEDQYYFYLFAIAVFFCGVLPVAEYWITGGNMSINGNIKLSWIYTDIVVYPCLGYYVHKKFECKPSTAKVVGVMWLINIATIILSCYMTYKKAMITGVLNESVSQGFHESFVLINCLTLFITAKWLFHVIDIPKILEKIIVSIGSCTFGIYLLHVLVMLRLPISWKLWDFFKAAIPNDMLSTILMCLCVMLICYVITWVLKRIPVVKKFI